MLRIHCLPRNMRPITCALLLLVLAIHQNDGVEVHFEASDSGFFLKHSRQPPVTPDIQLSSIQASPLPPTKTKTPYDSILSIDRFTVVQTTQPVSIRASYGPFSTKQTVPARYIVPDAVDNQGDFANNTTAALLELQQTNMHLDISAHLVRSAVSQDSPVLRVLFHTGADPRGHSQRQKICVLLHVSMGSQNPLKGRCIPEGEDGVCVAEVVIPSSWWPLLPPPHRDNNSEIPFKAPQRYVQVSYSVFEPPQRNPEQCEPKVQIQPLTTFTQVPLINAVNPPKELRADDTISILLPQYPLYPMSKIHVPVFLNQSSEQLVVAFTMKARVKSGIRIIGATLSNDLWNISIEKENSKHTTARVTAFRKDPNSNLESSKEIDYKIANASIFEVFSWLLEVGDDNKETLDGGKIVWSVTYVYNNAKDKDNSAEDTKKRLIAKLEINKDDIQAVLPMAKNWELMNTAVLTGRQVAQAMKVFIVSQAGKIADVTLQSSCHAEDESVIKVSSSCSSVYVDGSEIRGSSNASIIVKYGTYVGLAKFTVWMPEFPLEVYIADFRLSQIKGWKVLDENHFMHKQSQLRRKRSFTWGHQATGYYNNVGGDKLVCRARYQQSPVEVYARFLAIDQNSGRISYFISRRTGLRVTDLVQPLLRVADPKIACLKGRILQGKSMGRTDVQVLSPITGRVIGAKEIRVGSDKVALAKLIVRVVSGLQLTITPDSTIENGYIAETSVTHKLTAQYQEGLLDIDLEFTDGSRTPLRDISVEDYFLLVESLDTEVVAFAPMLASHHPRVIAVGEGNGNLLRITLLLSEDCRTRRNVIATKQVKANVTPLATALASVEVDFNNVESASKMEAIQNDGISGRERKMFRNSGDLTDIIVGIPLRDDSNQYGPTIHARPHRGSIISMDNVHGKRGGRNDMTSMEIGMYVLLTAFCFAIIVFVISCVVYASKFRPMALDGGGDPLETLKGNFNTNILLREQRVLKEPTTNAHDWVWLGRSTMDRSSVVTNLDSTNFVPPKDQGMRITSNPISNYANNPASSPPKKISSFYKSENRVVLQPETEPIDAETPSDEPVYPVGHPIEYRPPVPPHRNIGVRASVGSTNTPSANNNAPEPPKTAIGHLYEYQNHRRNKSVGLSSALTKPNHEDINNLPPLTKPTAGAIGGGGGQCYENAALHKNMNRRSLNSSVADSKEMHNAEKLVENSICHKKNVFQFDSLTPKKSAVPVKNEEMPKGEGKLTAATLEEVSPDEEKVELVPPNPQRGLKKNGVKRATVVGNPMFSTNEDDDGASEEILGLDDLDMDYEQIMDYFDNLKESNA